MYVKKQRNYNCQNNFEKEQQNWRTNMDFNNYYKATIIKTV